MDYRRGDRITLRKPGCVLGWVVWADAARVVWITTEERYREALRSDGEPVVCPVEKGELTPATTGPGDPAGTPGSATGALEGP